MRPPHVSILFNNAQNVPDDGPSEAPAFFGDLRLDQIISSLTAGRESFRLTPYLHRPLRSVETVRYRHQVLRDLEREPVRDAVAAFADGMARMRTQLHLADRLQHPRQQQRWFVSAAAVYCSVVSALSEALAAGEIKAPGLQALSDYLSAYTSCDAFASLSVDTARCEAELSALTYVVQVRGTRVIVGAYDGEPDVGEEVASAFAKFRQGAGRDHRVRFREFSDMNHVESQILDLVARLFPEPFARLAEYRSRHDCFVDPTVARCEREVEFYLAYLEYIAPLTAAGLSFSYPRVSARSKEISATATFDLALAAKLVAKNAPVVCNDFHLSGPERVLVVSGPNNGGKTTFARTFGQLHYLAGLGLPVPGRDTRLFLPDRIFSHFERKESIATLRGKFEDELVRVHAILENATPDSVLVMNESFGSTTLRDAVAVGTEVMRQIIALDTLGVFVTFVDELASLGEGTVSMMSTVMTDDPAVRTFKVVRKPADGLAYASALADKYGLDTASLRRELAR
jgi:DNA mismatch repair protein MutS